MAIKRWFEYGNTSDLKVSAGIILILNKRKILLLHPTKSKWYGTYSVPKGGVNPGESNIDAAIRELNEETSLNITKDMISNLEDPIIIDYQNKSGKKYKKLVLFKVFINSTSEIGLKKEILDRDMLQLTEVDWGGFLDIEEGELRIFHRMHSLLDLIR